MLTIKSNNQIVRKGLQIIAGLDFWEIMFILSKNVGKNSVW